MDDTKAIEKAWSGELGEFQTLLTLQCPSGQIVAADPLVNPDRSPILNTFSPGDYPVMALVHPEHGRLAFAMLKISDDKIAQWEFVTSYGVDAGLGCYMDVAAAALLVDTMKAMEQDRHFGSYYDDVIDEELYGDGDDNGSLLFTDHKPDKSKPLNIAIFESGWGDGLYDVFAGKNEDGNVVCFVTDFQLFEDE